MTEAEKRRLTLKASQVFSPAAPIREPDVFAGRIDQLRAVIDAVNQRGQHALIYGERGVGKTSLANVLAELFNETGQQQVLAPHVNCDAGDDFGSIWAKVCRQASFFVEQPGFGLNADLRTEIASLADYLSEPVTPESVLDVARVASRVGEFIPVIDEFDRVQDERTTRQFTDAIKALSDQVPAATVVLVGVADTVEELVAEHQSVERALVQVRMPRMSEPESAEILAKGTDALGMTIRPDAADYIARLSQGLPHYTHLLGLHASRAAVDSDRLEITVDHAEQAVGKAITGAQQTLQRAYHQATMSPRSDNLYRQVLLACAMASADQLGYFAAADVREPMGRIMGRKYTIAAFSRHLFDFCDSARGPVLERIGTARRYRFRFRNPLLQPFVIMQGLSVGLIDRERLQSQP